MQNLPYRIVGLALALLALLSVSTPPAEAQFAGCITDQDEPYAARFILYDIFDVEFQLTAIGLNGFDPQIEVRDERGQLVRCNNNWFNVNALGADLPTGSGGFDGRSAFVEVRYYAEENPDGQPQDYEVIVSSADGTSGEFVLIYTSAALDGAEIDEYGILTTDAQKQANVPFFMMAFNDGQDGSFINPELRFATGAAYETGCSASATPASCDGLDSSLATHSVRVPELGDMSLGGTDVIIQADMAPLPALTIANVRAFQGGSAGSYGVIFQGTVVYP